MTVGEFCCREVVIAERNTTIVEAAKLMRQYHVGDLVVVDRSCDTMVPVGIVTDRDIVMAIVALEVNLDDACVEDIMSDKLITTGLHDGIMDTLRKMRTKGIRRIPVVDDEGNLEGILSIEDILALLADELALLAKTSSRCQELEKKRRP